MSLESHRKFLEKSACKAVVRAKKRMPGSPVKIDDLRQFKIQTVEPWKRICCLILGAFFVVMCWIFKKEDMNVYAVVFTGLLGSALILISTFGRRKTKNSVLDAAGEVMIFRILDGL